MKLSDTQRSLLEDIVAYREPYSVRGPKKRTAYSLEDLGLIKRFQSHSDIWEATDLGMIECGPVALSETGYAPIGALEVRSDTRRQRKRGR